MFALFKEFLKDETSSSPTYQDFKNSDDPETVKAAKILEADENSRSFRDSQVQMKTNNNSGVKHHIKQKKVGNTPILEEKPISETKKDIGREI